jgi:hypothetical protein
MGYYDTYESKYIYIFANFQILFQVNVVQFGINFDINAEIHLLYIK